MTVGEIIKYWRLEFNMTQVEFSKLAGVTQQTLSRWESDIHIPTIVECVRLARALRLSLDEMFEDLKL